MSEPLDSSRQAATAIQKRHGAYLPHWHQHGAWYFVTFRLADSLPAPVLARVRAKLDLLEQRLALRNGLDARTVDYRAAQVARWVHERELDRGHGSCALREARCAQIVRDSLAHFAALRYLIAAWVVMPNHVHTVVQPAADWSLSQITHSWKSFSAKQCNKLLGRRGPFWQSESFDRIIRSQSDFDRRVRYVLDNPRKSGLRDWPWVGTTLPSEQSVDTNLM